MLTSKCGFWNRSRTRKPPSLLTSDSLKAFGPTLGGPQVDTLKGAGLTNLKELHVQYQGELWRVLFVFDPKRRAILLVGGNKQGDARWYKKAIPLAEQRCWRHLEQMKDDNDRKT